jgi:hypothetical protein
MSAAARDALAEDLATALGINGNTGLPALAAR